MTTDEIRALVMRFVDEPWNKGNVQVFDELCAPEYSVRNGTERNAQQGLEPLKQGILNARAQDPNFKAEVKEIIVEGDRVAYEWSMEGLEDGKFTQWVGITILHLKDGKIVEDHFIADTVKEPRPTA